MGRGDALRQQMDCARAQAARRGRRPHDAVVRQSDLAIVVPSALDKVLGATIDWCTTPSAAAPGVDNPHAEPAIGAHRTPTCAATAQRVIQVLDST